ncbi:MULTISPECIES: ABC transporter ATP-binding protein [Bacillus]|uniref:Antibiotic ABC transporter ATP-binding protein n=2 Tax=Bacillus sonorensis TaxID=119858 RepID=M5P0C7_9BACI|nr:MULTISPECIES: ABC transporter ATP-binding protein [Bacillus]EME73546.1 antibiotic ABC transporter ATP-binding protein [Bacillus sonorensis L12]TWK80758.1 ABC transporter ATP-binding protein NatA [Bacillus paralicheniformis]ASB86965.1 Aliphatic sulfonates import ATP-binding protein SsuB [Bacillus sonorensis]MBG9914520.1 antibiotic ABC transporter ATP-binding protein [Bacillus sonorensis]MCF7616216.1 ABC transporter ATP-binding protein [Bacillus sonorensis]
MIAELHGVQKRFKGKRVLEDINLTINENEIVGIVGGNGSGKTTILRLLAGLMYADRGDVIVHGKKIKKGQFPGNIGLLIETPRFIERLSGYENLQMLAKLKGEIGEAEIRSTMEKFKLDPHLKDAVKTYSLGMNQRLGLVQVFMEKPKLLLLDEPTNALDEDSKKRFEEMIFEARQQGAGIALVSHNKEEIKRLCDRVYMLEEGVLKEVQPV